MSLRIIVAAVVGFGLLVTGIAALASPITADDGRTEVECGTGFAGPGAEAKLMDDAHDQQLEVTGDGSGSTHLAGTCEDKIGLRRLWAYPAGGIGLIVLGAAVFSWRRSPGQRDS